MFRKLSFRPKTTKQIDEIEFKVVCVANFGSVSVFVWSGGGALEMQQFKVELNCEKKKNMWSRNHKKLENDRLILVEPPKDDFIYNYDSKQYNTIIDKSIIDLMIFKASKYSSLKQNFNCALRSFVLEKCAYI